MFQEMADPAKDKPAVGLAFLFGVWGFNLISKGSEGGYHEDKRISVCFSGDAAHGCGMGVGRE